MKPSLVALVAPADRSRAQIARYLRDGGYEVSEYEELAIPSRFESVVVVDVGASEVMRTHVRAWLRAARALRVVVVSSKPAMWKALALARRDDLYVLAAPAFGWEIVDALRATRPALPRA